jgi:hypothetical protein
MVDSQTLVHRKSCTAPTYFDSRERDYSILIGRREIKPVPVFGGAALSLVSIGAGLPKKPFFLAARK